MTVRAIATAEQGGCGIVLADTLGATAAPAGGVSTDDFLRAVFGAEDDAYGWHIDPSVNTWANDLPAEVRRSLFSCQPTRWGEWRALYIPGRFLDVRYGSRGRHRRTLYDLSAMFPGERGQLAATAQRWGVNVPAVVSIGDAARVDEYPGWPLSAIVHYAEQRAAVISQLASTVITRLAQLEINPYGTIPETLLPPRLHGIGSVGTVLLKAANADRWVARYSPNRQPVVADVELLPLFQRAYYGGRIETAVLGTIDAPVWRMDIRSAYAWALSHVGAVGRIWDHVDAWRPAITDRMSIWRVSWHTPAQWLGPFPWRDGSRRGTVYPTAGEGWYWWPEVRAALALHGPEQVRVHEGYVSPRSSLRPLQPVMSAVYTLRQQLEAVNDPAATIVKGAANAVWGKLSQTISVGGLPGRFYNPALAGWVSSAVRAALLAHVGSDDLHVAAIMTDGYITDRPEAGAKNLSASMGGWKSDRFERAELYAPGIYRLWRADSSYETAQTGVQRLIDFDWLAAELSRAQTAEIKGRWFVPHILADVFPGTRFETNRCRWIESSGVIDPRSIAAKRQGAIKLPDLRWSEDMMAFGPWGEVGDRLASPYHGPPAWKIGGFDPVLEAASMAMRGSR